MIVESQLETTDSEEYSSFKRRDFLDTEGFNAADFISNRKHIPLDHFKHELHSLLRRLKLELVELINRDYAVFISLSSNLLGVNSMIADLRTPLVGMKQDIQNVLMSMDKVISAIETGLKQRAAIRTKKAHLEVFLNIHESLERVQAVLSIGSMDESLVERVALEYNRLDYLVSRGSNLRFVQNISWRIDNVKATLVNALSGFVKDAFTALQADNTDAHARSSLGQSLRVFVLIDRVSDALSVFELSIVVPFIEDHVNQDSLSLSPHSSETVDSLQSLLNSAIAFFKSHCLPIDAVAQPALSSTQYNLLIDAVWAPFMEQLMKRIPIIFNAGIPDVFHRNYLSCVAFMQQFESLLCSSVPDASKDQIIKTQQRLVSALRVHPVYAEFKKKWQLSTYYQIRHNEIVKKFQSELVPTTTDSTIAGDPERFTFVASYGLVSSLNTCWSDSIYLTALTFRFWKLSLTLINRYHSWIANGNIVSFATEASGTNHETVLSTSSSHESLVSQSAVNSTGAVNLGSETSLKLSVLLYCDLLKLYQKIQSIFQNQIIPKLPVDAQTNKLISTSFNQSIDPLKETLSPQIASKIATQLIHRCADPLRTSVKNIPGLYRRTNKETPTKCSYFIPIVFQPMTKFIDAYYDQLDGDTVKRWQKVVANDVTRLYVEQLKETLNSIKSIEESLRRFKKSRKPNTSGVDDAGVAVLSDEDKMRLQMSLDVEQYKLEARNQGLVFDGPDFFDDVLKMLELVENH